MLSNIQKRSIFGSKNFISTSQKLSFIEDTINFEKMNDKSILNNMHTFKSEKLGDICKMNNKFYITKYDYKKTNLRMEDYDLFDYKFYYLKILLNNYEQYIFNSSNKKCIINNIKILNNEQIREYLLNFMEIHESSSSNILNETELYTFFLNKKNLINDCVIYIDELIEVLNKYKLKLDEFGTEFSKKYQWDIINKLNLPNLIYILNQPNGLENYVKNSEYNLYDIIVNDSDKHNLEPLIDYIKYISYKFYIKNTKKFDEEILNNFKLLNKQKQNEIIKSVFQNELFIRNYLEDLLNFFTTCQNLKEQDFLELDIRYIYTAVDYLEYNKKGMLHVNLNINYYIDDVISNLDEELTKATKLKSKLSELNKNIKEKFIYYNY